MTATRQLMMRQIRRLLRLQHEGAATREIGRILGVASQLLEARDECRLLKMQRDLAAVKLLIIDGLGYRDELAVRNPPRKL